MKKVVVIVGPTGVGKTKLSIKLAKEFQGEVISGDSVQVYKGLDIGSAKVKENQMQGVKHHLIDILDPDQTYDVARFQKEARELIKAIKYPFIVGGTGLYIKAALDNYDFSGEKRDLDYESQFSLISNQELYERLVKQDYKASLKIHPNNRRRVLRALQLSLNKKRSQRIKKDEPLFDYKIFYLTLPKQQLKKRIDDRVEIMIKEGFLAEVKALKEKGYSFNIIGYKQLNDYLDGLITLDEAINEIKVKTRRYAKRQKTWFKNQMNTVEVDVSDFSKAYEQLKQEIKNFWE